VTKSPLKRRAANSDGDAVDKDKITRSELMDETITTSVMKKKRYVL
jgi:hypothetical protein